MRRDPTGGDLSIEECWDRLRASCMGRLALSAEALPVILPVRYFIDGHTIVMALAAHPPFEPVVDQVVAAFAVESVEPATCSGWTVHAQGMLHCRPAGLIVRMVPEVVTGWRIELFPDLDAVRRASLG